MCEVCSEWREGSHYTAEYRYNPGPVLVGKGWKVKGKVVN